jgi:hypothetical protein
VGNVVLTKDISVPHLKNIILERQLSCCLKRIRWKLGRYEKFGIPEQRRPYMNWLQFMEAAIEETLAADSGGSL